MAAALFRSKPVMRWYFARRRRAAADTLRPLFTIGHHLVVVGDQTSRAIPECAISLHCTLVASRHFAATQQTVAFGAKADIDVV